MSVVESVSVVQWVWLSDVTPPPHTHTHTINYPSEAPTTRASQRTIYSLWQERIFGHIIRTYAMRIPAAAAQSI
jgi:hypothetical protein